MLAFTCFVYLLITLTQHEVSSKEVTASNLSTAGNSSEDDITDSRTSDPRDHTAAGDIQEVNQKVKPRLHSGEHKERFDPELYMSDQLFEGCLTLDKRDKDLLSHGSDLRKEDKKTHITYQDKLWPNRDIPYDISFTGTNVGNQEKFERAVNRALRNLQSKTCLTFRPKRASDRNWIEFFTGEGCFANFGRKYWGNLPTFISLDVDCWKEDIALHMLLHALGFLHEQNRVDRDSYIRVNWPNVLNGKSSIFHRHSLHNTDIYHFVYDFESIMHFPRNAYSKKPSLFTLQARHNPNKVLGGTDLSKLDVEKVKRMFCTNDKIEQGGTITANVIWTEWSACSKTCGLGQRFRKEQCSGGNCDEVRHEMKVCRISKCVASHFDTNFDTSPGIWIVPETFPFACEWSRLEAKNDMRDHTTGAGWLLKVDTSSHNCVKGQPAFLVSKFIDKNTYKKCIDFYYMMDGEDVGDFQLYIIYKSGHSMLLWERNGNQGDEWKQGAASLPITDEKYRIKFSFRVGGSKKSKMLLDDIFFDDNECLEGIQRCVNLHNGCEGWANSGECFKNPAYMMRKCCKACSEIKCIDKSHACRIDVFGAYGSCSPNLWAKCCHQCEDCLDKHPDCKRWADSGECNKNPDWMKVNCKHSCKQCMLVER